MVIHRLVAYLVGKSGNPDYLEGWLAGYSHGRQWVISKEAQDLVAGVEMALGELHRGQVDQAGFRKRLLKVLDE